MEDPHVSMFSRFSGAADQSSQDYAVLLWNHDSHKLVNYGASQREVGSKDPSNGIRAWDPMEDQMHPVLAGWIVGLCPLDNSNDNHVLYLFYSCFIVVICCIKC